MNTSIEGKAAVAFADGRFDVRLGNGVSFSFPIAGNWRLEGATLEQLANVEVDEDGLHWPEIDEDLSFAGLLRGDWGQFVRPPTNAERRCWCARGMPRSTGEKAVRPGTRARKENER